MTNVEFYLEQARLWAKDDPSLAARYEGVARKLGWVPQPKLSNWGTLYRPVDRNG